MSTLLIVPMKDPASAKTRLSAAMHAEERENLARMLFANTLSFFAKQHPTMPRLVVTESESIAFASLRQGAQVLRETHRRGLNAAVEAAALWAVERGFTSTLIVAADVAVWEASEVQDLFVASIGRTVVIAEAVDGGTNALLLPAPNACPFRYGPGSALMHEIAAKQRGYRTQRLHLPFLARDVDTPGDLELFEIPERRGPRTQRSE
ncbi:MAG: 2-phospho-L-lactate guanylyltransferase [Betaproteobacteria bacterium]|nr:2-phospho-L-lactate guanylyltransferase [Betaproteobacteria bacterium]